MQDVATALDYMAHDLVCLIYSRRPEGEPRAQLWLNPDRRRGPSNFDVKLRELFAATESPLPDGLRDLIVREARKTDPLPVSLVLGLLLGVGLALIVGRR